MTLSRFRKTCVVVALLACGSFANAFAQETNPFGKANAEYNAGRYREAIELYDQAVQSGQTTAALFYNLGNAWFRAGDLGRAILNYERALVLEPQHPEADANRRLARDKARALDLPTTWWDRRPRAHPKHTRPAAAISFWLAAFALAALFMSGVLRTHRARSFFVS
jgi:tetratricopeptide (TPR) repeat protein